MWRASQRILSFGGNAAQRVGPPNVVYNGAHIVVHVVLGFVCLKCRVRVEVLTNSEKPANLKVV